MKILMPLSDVNELQELISLGPDEFYFGISLVKHLTEMESFNFRPFDNANLKSIKEAKQAVKIVHRSNLKCYLALNGDIFSPELFKEALDVLGKLFVDIDGAIVSDVVLIEEIKRRFPDLKIITSTRCNSFNSWNLKFYKDLGISRFTLPGHFNFKDIIKMLEQFPDTEFDIFVKNDGCPYINGMCSYMHNVGHPLINMSNESFCRLMEKKGKFYLCSKDKNKINISKNASLERYKYHKGFECKICWMHELWNFKDKIILKIAGRDNTLEKKKEDLIFIKHSLKILEKGDPDKEKVPSLYQTVYFKECFHKCGFDL